MKNRILTTASVLALVISMPALADMHQESKSQAPEMPEVTTQEMKEGWQDTKEAVSEAAETVAEEASETYHDLKMEMTDSADNGKLKLNPKMTANGMIGQPVHNTEDERVGTVYDIILDRTGEAEWIIISDSDYFNLGLDLVAFDYELVVHRDRDGDLIIPLTEDAINRARPFSYEATDMTSNASVMPPQAYSVSRILDGALIDPQADKLADIDNISFENDEANKLIVAFDQTLGMGGKHAAMNFDEADVVSRGGGLYMQLSQAEALLFRNYKKTMQQ